MRVTFEGIMQIDLMHGATYAFEDRPSLRLLINFNVALLAALGLRFDQPTVALVTTKMYQLLGVHIKPWDLYTLVIQWSLIRETTATSSFGQRSCLEIHTGLHSRMKSKIVRLVCHGLKYSTLLPPCDESGAKTYRAWMMEVEDTFIDVVRKMNTFKVAADSSP